MKSTAALVVGAMMPSSSGSLYCGVGRSRERVPGGHIGIVDAADLPGVAPDFAQIGADIDAAVEAADESRVEAGELRDMRREPVGRALVLGAGEEVGDELRARIILDLAPCARGVSSPWRSKLPAAIAGRLIIHGSGDSAVSSPSPQDRDRARPSPGRERRRPSGSADNKPAWARGSRRSFRRSRYLRLVIRPFLTSQS